MSVESMMGPLSGEAAVTLTEPVAGSLAAAEKAVVCEVDAVEEKKRAGKPRRAGPEDQARTRSPDSRSAQLARCSTAYMPPSIAQAARRRSRGGAATVWPRAKKPSGS